MALNILKGTDPVTIQSVVVLIYGQPGVGKTSTAFTANEPLLFDFDAGAHRSSFRQDSVPVTKWGEIASLDESDLANYSTLVVDTVGRCLDALTLDIIKSDPKMGRRDGSLTLQGFGALKSRFASWINTIRSFGRDVVLIAHDKEDRRGDDTVMRPDVTGGSYAELFKVADAVGYYAIINGKRTLMFSPTDNFVAKNPAELDHLTVPDLHERPEFLGEVIQTIKDKAGEISDASRKVAERIAEIRGEIDKATSATALNKIRKSLEDEPRAVAVQAKRILWDFAQEYGFDYDKDAGKFVKGKEEPEPQEATA